LKHFVFYASAVVTLPDVSFLVVFYLRSRKPRGDGRALAVWRNTAQCWCDRPKFLSEPFSVFA